MSAALIVIAITVRWLGAQGTDSAAAQLTRPVFSMGQPSRWLPYVSGFGTMSGQGGAGALALAGVERPVLNPIMGILSFSGEALGSWYRGTVSPGVRFLAGVPAFGLSAGADWQPTSHSLSPMLSFRTSVRRAGLLGGGSVLRFDWSPARRQTVALGVQLPAFQPFAGRTRPRRVAARLPYTSLALHAELMSARLPPSTTAGLATVRTTALLISAYINLFSPAAESTISAAANRPFGGNFDIALVAYHAALERAFASAVGDSVDAARIVEGARAAVLDRTIVPYDALFGQVKQDDALDALLALSARAFKRWLADSASMADDARARALSVFARWLIVLRELHAHLLVEAGDSRLVWLPLQLALTGEQYRDQRKVDALLGRVVGHPFTENDAPSYLHTADLTEEIARSILAARRYHVLWVHDFTGRRPSGALDDISYTIVADAYLPALTAAVQAYDSGGTFPQYTILLDAYYYYVTDGRIWMSILENPLDASIHLRPDEAAQAAHLRMRLATLRAAVARSSRLQREAAAQGGERWLAEIVKVSVNVVLPSDFSFRSNRSVPPLRFTPDNVSRDHRKLALYDLTEADPYAGELLAAGIGIGEGYASATWEDRGYRLRGPAALEARAALRRMLRANGFHDNQIPEPLRATSAATTTPAADGQARPRGTRVLQVHNEPGFGAKASSAARAVLYTLAPSGSMIIAPDPLWTSETWAGMLAGAAARGSHVIIIAPAKENAPSRDATVFALERDVLRRLLRARDHLATMSDTPTGDLRVGVYNARASLTDVTRRAAEVRDGVARAPWILELIPFDSSALEQLNDAVARTAIADEPAERKASDLHPRLPQLHQKTLLIAWPGAVDALVSRFGWQDGIARSMEDHAPPTEYERSLSDDDRERMQFYFSLGSQNHNQRSLLLDGELSLIVSGYDASLGLVDMFYLMARTTWIERERDIDRLVPAPGRLMTRLGRLLRFMM